MWKDERGFTLLEVIVALVIFATGFLTVVVLFANGARLGAQSDPYLRGTALAHHKMSEFEVTGFPTENTGGDFPGLENYRWRVQVEPYDSPVNKSAEGIEMSRVNLAVLWQEGSSEKKVLLTSLRLNGAHYPASDQVLLNQAQGQEGLINPARSEVNTDAAPGTVEAPADTPQPAQPKGFQFDISGHAVNSQQSGNLIGLAK